RLLPRDSAGTGGCARRTKWRRQDDTLAAGGRRQPPQRWTGRGVRLVAARAAAVGVGAGRVRRPGSSALPRLHRREMLRMGRKLNPRWDDTVALERLDRLSIPLGQRV